jgi:hypothetical protein
VAQQPSRRTPAAKLAGPSRVASQAPVWMTTLRPACATCNSTARRRMRGSAVAALQKPPRRAAVVGDLIGGLAKLARPRCRAKGGNRRTPSYLNFRPVRTPRSRRGRLCARAFDAPFLASRIGFPDVLGADLNRRVARADFPEQLVAALGLRQARKSGHEIPEPVFPVLVTHVVAFRARAATAKTRTPTLRHTSSPSAAATVHDHGAP